MGHTHTLASDWGVFCPPLAHTAHRRGGDYGGSIRNVYSEFSVKDSLDFHHSMVTSAQFLFSCKGREWYAHEKMALLSLIGFVERQTRAPIHPPNSPTLRSHCTHQNSSGCAAHGPPHESIVARYKPANCGAALQLG